MSAATTGALLRALCRELSERLEAPATLVSRVVGDVLIPLVEHVPEGRTLHLGLGYLVPDYPLTGAVLAERRPARVSLEDSDADPAEAELLRALGYDALLMVPLVARDGCWGLVEAYRAGAATFSERDEAVAVELVDGVGRTLEDGS